MKLGSCLSRIIVGSGDSKSPAYELGSWHVPVSVTLGNWYGLAWSQERSSGKPESPAQLAQPFRKDLILEVPVRAMGGLA